MCKKKIFDSDKIRTCDPEGIGFLDLRLNHSPTLPISYLKVSLRYFYGHLHVDTHRYSLLYQRHLPFIIYSKFLVAGLALPAVGSQPEPGSEG